MNNYWIVPCNVLIFSSDYSEIEASHNHMMLFNIEPFRDINKKFFSDNT